MKKFTDSKQTETLISLGFPLPSTVVDLNDCYIVDRYGAQEVECDECNYSIGELMKMLPKHIFPNGRCFDLHICANQNLWVTKYTAVFYETDYRFCSTELIDALYDMIVLLKEEGVI